MQDTILVLSRNPGLSGLTARTLRCRQVYCTPLPFATSAQEASALMPRGIVLAADDEDGDARENFDFSLLTAGVPVLALGAAAAALCRHYGGRCDEIASGNGAVTLGLTDDPLFSEITGGERMLRGIYELTLPDVLVPLATATERVIGFKHTLLPLYALQYPIERNDPDAAQLLYNFACRVCGCKPDWDEDSIIDQAVNRIRNVAAEGRVMCAVSGGVDSAVCAKLASLAVGDRLICVFVDTGLFRLDEPQSVIGGFMDTMGLVVAYVDAKEAFLRTLSGVSGPEDKERIASSLMTQILLKQLIYEPDVHTLIMGTNFNDALYGFSPSGEIDVAKGDADLRVSEPVRNLFKDEVRRLAVALELPASIAERRPFPSSGLALRVMGNVTEERLDVLRAADACFTEEIRQGGYEKRLWQYYATLVEGPDQPGTHAICLRALQAAQGGAYAARLPFDVLERAAERIRSEVHGISRVVYDLTPSAHYGELE